MRHFIIAKLKAPEEKAALDMKEETSMNRMLTEKYIRIYMKRNLLTALFCAILCFVPLFIVSLIYDLLSYDLVVSFAPFFVALLCVAFSYLYTFRFRRMISEQEKIFSITFDDTAAQHLETTVYLSDDWLIYAGSAAFYKGYVQSISSKTKHGLRGGSSNRVALKTIDGRHYVIWVLSSTVVKRLREWSKA